MREEARNWGRIRIMIVAGSFACFFAVIAARMFCMQILQHDSLVKLAEKQHNRTVTLTPVRGGIFDRSGAPMAVSLEMDSLYADPRKVRDPLWTASTLVSITGGNRHELARKLSSDKGFVWLERRISPEVAERVKALKLPGIGFVKESKRFYPNFEMASHVLGFTGVDPGGLEGIERRYDSTIMGNSGYMMTERDALGRDVLIKGAVIKEASPGRSLVLTIDKNIQYLAEKELAKAVAEHGGKTGMAVVAEPSTGRILAMANYPTFNPNSYHKYTPFQLRNRSVADSFEPGSTFKIFLMASAIEEKVARPGDVYNCENGRYRIQGRTINDDHPHGRATVSEVLKYSSNIGSAKIGFKLGQERYHRYLKSFGFGDKTGIDLPAETSGLLRPLSKWYGTDIAAISFGQGVSVTAIQLVAAVSAVANGGILMKPYLVERVTDESGREIQKFQPQMVRRVISGDSAKAVTAMMEGVVAEGGTGTKAAIEGVRVAGKTGTAEKVDHVTKGYSRSKRTASFVGFVPADNPQLTILVVVDEPSGSKYGGVVAAPAFREIAINSLAYIRGSGSEVPNSDKGKLQVKAAKPVVVEVRNATVKEKKPESIPEAEGGGMDVAGAGSVMPDFRGMSMRKVLQVMEKRQINIQVRGSGRVIEQHPQPGQVIQGADEIWVRLTPSV